MEVTLPILQCNQCSYRWYPRKQDVQKCPRCGSVRWDQPKGDPRSGLRPEPPEKAAR